MGQTLPIIRRKVGKNHKICYDESTILLDFCLASICNSSLIYIELAFPFQPSSKSSDHLQALILETSLFEPFLGSVFRLEAVKLLDK